MAMRKKTGKDIPKPPASAKEPLTDSLTTKQASIETGLQSPKWQDRLKAVKELCSSFEPEKAVRLLAERLEDRSSKVRNGSLAGLSEAALLDYDVSGATEALAKTLTHKDPVIRSRVAWILGESARNHTGTDFSDIIQSLANAFSDELKPVRFNVGDVLASVARKDHQTREKIVSALTGFMNSDRFLKEADQNTAYYVETIEILDQIMQVIAQNERGAA